MHYTRHARHRFVSYKTNSATSIIRLVVPSRCKLKSACRQLYFGHVCKLGEVMILWSTSPCRYLSLPNLASCSAVDSRQTSRPLADDIAQVYILVIDRLPGPFMMILAVVPM
jgi:hypothetical protein